MPEIDFRAPRLFVDVELAPGAAVALERDQSNYLGNVLRLAAGDAILVFNGRDGEWQALIPGRKRADKLGVGGRAPPQETAPAGPTARSGLRVRAAQARKARLHGAESRRDGRFLAAAGHDSVYPGGA